VWDGAQWLPGLQTGTVYYFRRDASDIGGGYEQITQTPQTGAEKTASTTLNNASGTVVFDQYATNPGEPGLTQLLAGTWELRMVRSSYRAEAGLGLFRETADGDSSFCRRAGSTVLQV